MSTQATIIEKYNEVRDNFLNHVKSEFPPQEKLLAGIIMEHLTGVYYVKISARSLNKEFKIFGFNSNIIRSTISDTVSIINMEIENTGKNVRVEFGGESFEFFIQESE